MEPAEGERVFPPFSMPLFGSPSVLTARPSARPPRSRSLVSKGKTHAAHGHGPAAHSLAWAPQAAGTAIALSSAPAAAIYCHTPTYLPSFLLPEAIPTIATNLSPR